MKVTEQIIVHESALHDWHVGHDASMAQRDEWFVPANYGGPANEYAVVREHGAGLIDLSSRGRIRVSGSEAIQFLNGLITNDMKTLKEHCWMSAAFPNVQGRLIASVRVMRIADEQGKKGASPVFLLDTEGATRDRVLKTIERFTFAGDFQVADITAVTAQISIQGANAVGILEKVLGSSWVEPAKEELRIINWNDAELVVVRASHTAEDGFDLITDAAHALSLWQALLAGGAKPVGFDALEILRIEAGISRYGRDLDETLVVSETNLDDAVSFTKGCYVGQEIIARIKYRGHVAKKITGVAFDGEVSAEAGASVMTVDEQVIGRLTSVAFSPKLQKTIALALIKYQYLAAGTKVKVVATETLLDAEITDLPFVKGSW